jgi:tetratricopeptide (TPR) repeat protein
MRLLLLVAAGLLLEPHAAGSQSPDRVTGWRGDIDSVVHRISQSHPNPWAHRSSSAFHAEANALRDSVPRLSDGRILTGIMRLVASIGDGHTGVIDLGPATAAAWFPIRFALFADGLWVTAIDSANARIAGTRVLTIGGRPADEVVRKLLTIAQGDNIFNRRQHTAMLSNGVILNALGFSRQPDTLVFTVADTNRGNESVRLAAAKAGTTLGWEQWGEMYGPPPFKLVTAFPRPDRNYLHPDANSDLPLHMRGRRAYWWTYVTESRTLYFQLNSVAARSQYSKLSLIETWSEALASADSQSRPMERFVLDLRYNSGGDGSQIPGLMRALIKRDTIVARPGRFFVLTSGKTFSAAADFVAELIEYMEPILVGEPPGAGLNSSGDAGSFRLPYSRVVISESTRYTQTAPAGDTSGIIPVNVPAPMRGVDYFARKDPALDAILSAPAPYPNVVVLLRDSGAVAARRLWDSMRSRNRDISWWQPWRWSELNNAAYDLLEKGQIADAITGFEINTERYPAKWETWDSLGEGYLKAGRKDDALKSYQQALRLDPRNWNVAAQKRIVSSLSVGKTP